MLNRRKPIQIEQIKYPYSWKISLIFDPIAIRSNPTTVVKIFKEITFIDSVLEYVINYQVKLDLNYTVYFFSYTVNKYILCTINRKNIYLYHSQFL